MKKITATLMAVLCASVIFAQIPETPQLEYIMRLDVSLGEAYSSGRTSKGVRNVIPITGGTFEGPDIKGTIIPGGADWQLTDTATGRTTVEAIYSIRTDDGVYIHIRNKGIIADSFTCAPEFEAPDDSRYAWLNNALFICKPGPSGPQGTITLFVWKVE